MSTHPQSSFAIDATFAVPFTHRLRLTSDVFDPGNDVLAGVIERGPHEPAKVLFFVDEGVAAKRRQLENEIREYVSAHQELMTLVSAPQIIPGGEACKNNRTIVEQICRVIHDRGFCRQSYVMAIGGGAVLDTVGFAAAIAHRGIRLIRFPTTTLAQMDSGVGVKNGINAHGKKNYFGTFAPPWAVINDEQFLSELSHRDWLSGFSEAVKVACIKERKFFDKIAGSTDAIRRRDHRVALPIIRRSAELHLDHITRSGDPFELQTARPLDFGHWAAHKLEPLTMYRLRHGEAVAIGLALDVVYSALAGLLAWADAEAILDCLAMLGFALYDSAMDDTATLLGGLEDFREHLGGQLTITLLRGIGEPVDVNEMDPDVIRKAIEVLASRVDSQNGGFLRLHA